MTDPVPPPLPPPPRDPVVTARDPVVTARDPGGPVFLHTRHYRQRRLVDAIRLLPVLAMALFLLPLLWPRGEVADSRAIVFLFGSWSVLIGLSALLSHLLPNAREGDEGEGRG